MLCYDIVNLGFFYFKENVTSAYLIWLIKWLKNPKKDFVNFW
jgi:hypothetical protein